MEYIKGKIPNYISARRYISELKKWEAGEAAREGREPREVIYCQFCGRGPFESMQSLRAHFGRCKGKAALRDVYRDGVVYRAGTKNFRIRARSIKLMSYLEDLEETLADRLGDKPKTARNYFYYALQGAIHTAAEDAVLFTEEEIQAAPVESPPPGISTAAGGGIT